MSLIRSHILVCTGTGCTSSESPKIIAEFEKQLAAQGMDKEAQVVRTGCFGLCALGPIVTIYPEGACYTHVTVDDVEEIVSEHIVKGRIVKRLLNRNEGGDGPATSLAETRFYKHQHRIALRNCGVINPESIDEYIGVDGYAALGKILTEHIPPQQVIDTVLASGLRGRGGAGFPTGKKWQFTADAVSPDGVKYVCCNADEGDPGAFMDRSVLEGDPHTILEAMTIAGYAVGAHQGYIYVRAEYPIAVKRLETAIRQAKEYGLLGKNIFDSGFDFDLELRLGAGAFVCGEETALMRSIEGHRGEPKTRPPFPAVKGLFDRPTTWRPTPTSPGFSTTAPRPTPPSAPRPARAPRSSPWAARSPTPVWWRFPWAPPCARWWRTSAAACRAARSSRPPRPAAPPAAAFLPPSSTPPSTTSPSAPSAP